LTKLQTGPTLLGGDDLSLTAGSPPLLPDFTSSLATLREQDGTLLCDVGGSLTTPLLSEHATVVMSQRPGLADLVGALQFGSAGNEQGGDPPSVVFDLGAGPGMGRHDKKR